MKHIRLTNACLIIFLATYFLLIPGTKTVLYLRDDNIRQSGTPRMAWDLFKAITPAYEEWANRRLQSDRAGQLSTANISGTEWPLFGSVFYLWAVESLQKDWLANPKSFPIEPAKYAHDAIDAASRLVADPSQAAWVIKHWGTNYLHRENVFYRALVIAALTSRQKLLADNWNMDLLRDQVESVSRELDESKHGVLNDYPYECYPGDILAAIMIIQSADEVLGTDHSDFVQRARRGFAGKMLDRRGLPPYDADAAAGFAFEPARGCGISYMLFTSPRVWPDVATRWLELYEKYFWQDRGLLHGFREFPNDLEGYNWYADVDAGPVLGGIGVAASAFGVAACRTMGRFDKAFPLTTELIVSSWPLPNGRLLIPRVLSNAADAPLLGEACILYNLTSQPVEGLPTKEAIGKWPKFIYLALFLYFGLGFLHAGAGLAQIFRKAPMPAVRLPALQLSVWISLITTGLILAAMVSMEAAALPIFLSLLFPSKKPLETVVFLITISGLVLYVLFL